MPADIAKAMLQEEKKISDKEMESFEGLPSLLSVMEQTEQEEKNNKENPEKQNEEREVEIGQDRESESNSFDENDPFF